MELEGKRRQLLDKLLEVEKSPTPKKKGYLREIYFEMFGGLPQDMIPEDRIPTQENEDSEWLGRPSDRKKEEPKKKSGGFFGAVKSMFKGSSKNEQKQDKKAEQAAMGNSLSKSMIIGTGIYENEQKDERFKEILSPSEYDTRSYRMSDPKGLMSSRYSDYRTFETGGNGSSLDHKHRLSASYISTSSGQLKEQ